MVSQENPHAGQGAVVLDIGGDIGALIVEMPSHMVDLEVEIIPTGTDSRPAVDPAAVTDPPQHDDHDHPHSHDHPHTHDAAHSHGGSDHSHAHGAPPHVAVVARPTPMGTTIYSLVYEIAEGTYDLYVRPSGPVRLTATVTGGQITESRWPDWEVSA
ncbi:hypothetical protein [Nakamurella sp. PAMC28650]|uniref:hypothetical protein n=1 Tax=Nakamurella sp. PAMC28650 TaxID=2762325 RepID=UPI00164E09C9|nr:hypothetical protein [Nakamurella sp. PAMC28650]QNK80292.1 hypothetical protein H7F38_19145 [Nakamurella sp. PAMC28650]